MLRELWVWLIKVLANPKIIKNHRNFKWNFCQYEDADWKINIKKIEIDCVKSRKRYIQDKPLIQEENFSIKSTQKENLTCLKIKL